MESVDSCRKHRRQRNMLNYTMGCNEKKPGCGKFYRTNNVVSSTNKLQGKDILEWKPIYV